MEGKNKEGGEHHLFGVFFSVTSTSRLLHASSRFFYNSFSFVFVQLLISELKSMTPFVWSQNMFASFSAAANYIPSSPTSQGRTAKSQLNRKCCVITYFLSKTCYVVDIADYQAIKQV